MAAFDVSAVKRRLVEAGGGYEVVHRSPGLELGVYVLVAPEPDRQQPHDDDEVYVVLEGSGTLEIEGESSPLREGEAIFVRAGADHRFTGYEGLSVLVIFTARLSRGHTLSGAWHPPRRLNELNPAGHRARPSTCLARLRAALRRAGAAGAGLRSRRIGPVRLHERRHLADVRHAHLSAA